MLHIYRKIDDFKLRLTKKFEDRLSKLPEEKKKKIQSLKEIEDEREKVFKEFEQENRKLELKYDGLLQNIYNKRKQKIEEAKSYPDFWYRVLSNHKITKDFINEVDKPLLKQLKDLRFSKLEDGNSFKLIFEFEKNEYFTNNLLEKTYYISEELLLKEIVSTKIDWIEGKNISVKKVTKKMKNKKTGDVKSVETEESIPSFFHFFTNLKFPTEEEVKKIDFETEKELAGHFDQEFEIGFEFIEEIIPYAIEFFVGVVNDQDEYLEYVSEQAHPHHE